MSFTQNNVVLKEHYRKKKLNEMTHFRQNGVVSLLTRKKKPWNKKILFWCMIKIMSFFDLLFIFT